MEYRLVSENDVIDIGHVEGREVQGSSIVESVLGMTEKEVEEARYVPVVLSAEDFEAPRPLKRKHVRLTFVSKSRYMADRMAYAGFASCFAVVNHPFSQHGSILKWLGRDTLNRLTMLSAMAYMLIPVQPADHRHADSTYRWRRMALCGIDAGKHSYSRVPGKLSMYDNVLVDVFCNGRPLDFSGRGDSWLTQLLEERGMGFCHDLHGHVSDIDAAIYREYDI